MVVLGVAACGAALAAEVAEQPAFTRIRQNGTAITINVPMARPGSHPEQWACSRDNRSGLSWEIKTHDEGLRDGRWSFTPYRKEWKNAGEIAGYRDSVSGQCDRQHMTGGSCNIDAYVEAVNRSGLCGQADWRLPSVAELIEVTQLQEDVADTTAMQNLMPGWYWTSTENVGGLSYPRVMLLPPGGSPGVFDGSYYLWLVRGPLARRSNQ